MNVAANKSSFLKVYLFLAFIEGLVVLTSLLLIPSDPKSAVFLGFSSSRLALMGVVILAALFFGGMGAWVSWSSPALQKSVTVVDRLLKHGLSRVLLLVLSLIGITALLIPPQRWGDAVDQFQRLAPLVAWMTAFAVQTLLLQFLWLDQKLHWQNLSEWKPTLRVTLIAGMILAGVSVLILWSRIGIDPDRSGWYVPGTPLLFTQVFLAWAAGIGILLRGNDLQKRMASLSPKLKLDILICTALWLAAVLIWGMEPLKKTSYFVQEPTPPNFAYYPYSDARLYDESAQSILVGATRDSDVLVRPLYAFFLALLHVMDGERFEQTILLQAGALAFIPVLMYGLASHLGSRSAGVIAAWLAIFRERNSIALTNVIEVSHSKLILSDVPTMALMLLAILVLVKWLSQSNQKAHWGIAVGASLGLLILIRSQAQLLIPVILIGMLFVLRFQWRKLVQCFLVFALGLLVVVAPWVWRNHQVFGRATVESTEFYIGFLASSYLDEGQSIRQLPDESFDDYYERMQGQIRDYMVRHPDKVASFYASHFVHNEIGSIVYLPMSLWLYDLRTYVEEMTFWDALQIDASTGSARRLGPGSVILFFLCLG
ncbi:MAG: glycosyltransferase family 39 protein, partial [Chloroflexota bacterium]